MVPKHPNDLDINESLYEMISNDIDGLAKCRIHSIVPQIFKEINQNKGIPTGMIVVSCPKCLPDPQGRIYGRGFSAIEEWQIQNGGEVLETKLLK